MEKLNPINSIKTNITSLALLCALALTIVSCDSGINKSINAPDPIELGAIETSPNFNATTIGSFSPVAYDLEATPDGSILVTQNGTVQQVRKGNITQVAQIPGTIGQPANGLSVVGQGSYFLASGGLDLASGAGVWHISNGNARLIGDIESFETANDPDAFEGPQWKDQACEEDPNQGFTAGPQSNPYHLEALTGSTVLVGDAAGNTVLSVKQSGEVDWVAVLTPPVDGNGNYRFLKTAYNDSNIDCYVQPVPTSVAVGPSGDYFVGELTGAPATPGWSRIWRIEAGASNVVCPSESCTLFADGLTSIIDLTFGPDGLLYVVEYDAEGWAVATAKAFNPNADLQGGTLKRFNPANGTQTTLLTGLQLPSAITFDKWGRLWMLENNLIGPTIRTVSLP